ncbi:spore germination protein [Paenibacillus taichungensis]|uniref:Spore germination protein n=1 Tax=Paenibacillus taichungensis TaxID=484184 RepID=A0A329QM32_9BACL|nr:spore germination protein [Paenibacillus taichungensis]RAW12789.1 spore germination protein [Paenibacillus taichungensis]
MTQPHTTFSELKKNISYVEQSLFQTDDLNKQFISLHGVEGVLLYIESLVDQEIIQTHVLASLYDHCNPVDHPLFTTLGSHLETDLQKAIDSLIQGKCLYILDGATEFYILSTEKMYARTTTEPENEGVIRGAHNGFIEQLSVNLNLIRRQIISPSLIVRYFNVGEKTRTKIAVVYLQDVANPELVDKVKERILSITSDMVLAPGFIEELIEDSPFSLFPQQLSTERPDRVIANLLEGRLAILAEGSPSALIAPVTFFAFYQSPDDYHGRWMVSSFLRLIRMMSFIIAFTLPAVYIATISFHSAILPLELAHTIKKSLQNIPFPALIEAMLLELIFEVLREAGVRLPSRVGQTIGIVGGLVIGDAIVRAGLVSYTMIIVVSLTAISSFLVPSHEMSSAVRILRFPMMIGAAIFGYIGIAFGLVFLTIHLCKLETFGSPYFAPVAPFRLADMKDVFIRFPIWALRQRPHDARPQQLKQQKFSRSWKKRE